MEFPKPDNWKTFETFCLKVFRRYLQAPDLQKYAREGQAQHGVDLFGTTRDHTRCGIQCKRTKALTEDEVVAEVEKAKSFEPRLDRYIIATTAQRDPALQRLAATLSGTHVQAGLFSVAVYAWADIEEILKVEPGLSHEVYGMAFPHGLELPAAAAAETLAPEYPPPPSDTHREIDEAFEFVAKGQPDVTIELLERIRRRRWDSLTDRERYRVVANIGNARLAQQDSEAAARAYLWAVELQPSDEDARALEALAYHLAKDREKAQELSSALCRDHPNLGRAHMIRIRTAPTECSMGELLESVPAPVRGHPEVALALADRSIAEGHPEDAEQILRDYGSDGQGWPALTLALASAVLEQAVVSTRVTAEGPVLSDPARLGEAEGLFDRVLEQLAVADPENFAIEAYLGRGTCRRLLGKHDGAFEDFVKARDASPSDARAAIALAQSAFPDRDDIDEAISILDRFPEEPKPPQLALLLGVLLHQRGRDGDHEQAVQVLEAQVPVPGSIDDEQRWILVETLADLYAEMGRGEEALELVEERAAASLQPVALHAIHGELEWKLGREEPAVAAAAAALDSLGESSDWNETRRVALLVQRLGRFREAFELWRRVVTPEFVSVETLGLLNCAREIGEDQFIRDFCRELRAAGCYDRRTLTFEVELLTRYNENEEARAVFQEYLEAKPNDKVARLNKTALAIREDWEELVERDLDLLPGVDEVDSPEMGRLVTDVLRSGPEPIQAVDYAYDLYRRFPDEAEAHAALIVALHVPGPAGVQIERPDSVVPGTAVCYTEVGSEQRQWLVVENAKAPSLSRDEYASTDGLVPGMLGKGVDDEFPLSQDGIRERTGTILEIQDKRVYRANELMIAWPQRFPDKPYFVPVPVKESNAPSPDDFAEIIKVMERLNEPREKVKGYYAAGRIPITTFGEFMGLSVFETVTAVAADGDLPVRACRGRTQDIANAVRMLDNAESAVLDPSAVTTLALLEEDGVIELLPFRCLVTEGILREIRDLARDDLPESRAKGYAGSNNGRLWLHEFDEEQEARKRQRLTEVGDRLERNCEVIGGGDLARLEVSFRRKLIQCVVQTSAEAAAAATVREAVLWTDDHLFWEMIKGELPGQRVWTQAVFIWADLRRRLERKTRSRITARLMSLGYVFTSSNPMTVVDTCEAASWSLDDVDVGAVLADFGSTAWDYETALGITAQTVARVWRYAPSPAHARAVTTRMLSHVAEREDHRRIIQFLAENVEALLLDGQILIPRKDQLTELLRTYLDRGGLSL